MSETKNPSPSRGKNGADHIWQVVVGVVLFVLAAIISVFQMISQVRKYKEVSIPIEH
jgi:hypothetical protein